MAKFARVASVEQIEKVNHDIKIAKSNLSKLMNKRKHINHDVVITFTEEEYKVLYEFLGSTNVDTIIGVGMTVKDDKVIYNFYRDLKEII